MNILNTVKGDSHDMIFMFIVQLFCFFEKGHRTCLRTKTSILLARFNGYSVFMPDKDAKSSLFKFSYIILRFKF